MKSLEQLIEVFSKHLESSTLVQEPNNLYDPVDYIMRLGGKRIRPALVLAALDLYSDELEPGLQAAMSVEMFHNFSLVHDDIMDKAPLRRGKETVHMKWNDDTAILSGDVMMIMAYDFMRDYSEPLFKKLVNTFTQTSIKICEGQRWDMDFETRGDVTIDEYLKMIEYKTAVLLGCALKMGALIGGADDADADHLYKFGKNVGIGFQIQDDLLDVFGDDPKVGKQIAGDIINNKKTYLYLKSLELLSEQQSARLEALFSGDQEIGDQEKIEEVKQLFKSAHVAIYADELKEAYLTLGLSHLEAVKIGSDKKDVLKSFATFLLSRKY